MPIMTVRHFTEADIPIRTELLREPHFQANLTDFAVSTADDGLVAGQRRTIEEQHRTKRIFTICGPRGDVVGFAWITSIDWRSQCCELSFGVLPRYRGGLGALAVAAAHQYLRAELNMRVIVNQVLDHNRMLHSPESLAAHQQVTCVRDSYTVGQWRAACYWTFTEADDQARQAQAESRRREVAERIRSAQEARS
jgi:RimJ/RimL family protein N-acetyltransferase